MGVYLLSYQLFLYVIYKVLSYLVSLMDRAVGVGVQVCFSGFMCINNRIMEQGYRSGM